MTSVPVVTGATSERCCGDAPAGDCAPGEECLPSSYIDPDDCPGGGCGDGEECLPSDYVAPCDPGSECLPSTYIDPADCPECVDCSNTDSLLIGRHTAENDVSTVTVNLDGGGFNLDTTPGSTVLVVVHTFANGAYADGDVTDNKGNGYTLIGDNNNIGSGVGVGVWIGERDGVRGLAHSWTFTGDATGPVMEVIELSGMDALAWDASTAAGSTDAASPFDVTAAAAISGRQWALYASTLDTGEDHAWGIPAGYTEIGEEGNGSQHLVSMSCVKLDETGTPTVGGTFAGSVANATNLLLTFKVAECPACGDANCSCPNGASAPYCLSPQSNSLQDTIMALTPHTYFKMDDASGLPQDSSGNGHHASAITGATYSQAPLTSKATNGIRLTGHITATPLVADPSSGVWSACFLAQWHDFDIVSTANGFPCILSWGGNSPPKFMLSTAFGGAADGRISHLFDSQFGDIGHLSISPHALTLERVYAFVIITNGGPGYGTSDVWVNGTLWCSTYREGDGVIGTNWDIGELEGGFFSAADWTVSNFAQFAAGLTYADVQALTEAMLDEAALAAADVFTT